jgi:hypothetical protein
LVGKRLLPIGEFHRNPPFGWRRLAPSPPKPRSGHGAGGAGSRERRPRSSGPHSDALLAAEIQCIRYTLAGVGLKIPVCFLACAANSFDNSIQINIPLSAPGRQRGIGGCRARAPRLTPARPFELWAGHASRGEHDSSVLHRASRAYGSGVSISDGRNRYRGTPRPWRPGALGYRDARPFRTYVSPVLIVDSIHNRGRDPLTEAHRLCATCAGHTVIRPAFDPAITGTGCCACAAIGQTAALPSPAMNSRRLICNPQGSKLARRAHEF